MLFKGLATRFLFPTLLSAALLCALPAGATPAAEQIEVLKATSGKELTALRTVMPDTAFSGTNLDAPDGSQTFLVFRASGGVGIEVREASCGAEGRIIRGAVTEKARIDPRHAFVLRGEIPEGCPSRSVCIVGTDTCWEPFESGEDGSLILKAPFKAWKSSHGVHLLVSDRDPNGTNVRASPGGAVTGVIAQVRKNSPDDKLRARRVFAMEQSGKWIRVSHAPGKTGWMHLSVLGSCTDFKDTLLRAQPDPRAKGTMVPGATRLHLLTFANGWAEVSTPSGQKGWLPHTELFSNPYSNCWIR